MDREKNLIWNAYSKIYMKKFGANQFPHCNYFLEMKLST